MFPLLGTLLVCVEEGCADGIISLHLQSRLLQIIDLAPLVLGIFSYILGISADRRLASEQLARESINEKHAIQAELALKLRQQNIDLEELNATLESLVYTASHDLKTPVINFDSLLTMLKMVKDTPGSETKVDEIIARMEQATKRFRATIDDLLEVSSLELKATPELKPVSLSQLVEGVMVSCAKLIQSEKATIQLELEEDIVLGEHRSLEVVFQHLIVNAVQYHQPGRSPEIKIVSHRLADKIEIRLSDNGRGIDMILEGKKIFKMFTKLYNNERGAGIGLYLVKRCVDKLGGEINVESTVGKGTTFTILLPSTEEK